MQETSLHCWAPHNPIQIIWLVIEGAFFGLVRVLAYCCCLFLVILHLARSDLPQQMEHEFHPITETS